LPSRDAKTDMGPGGGSTAIPLGCDRRTRKFSSPLAPSSTCASQGRHHHRCARQHRRRVAPQGRQHQARHRHGPGFFAQAGVGIPVTGTYHHRTPCCAICARHLQHLRRRASFQGRHHQRRTRPHRVIFLLPPTQGFKNQVSAHPLKTKIEKLLNTRIRAIAHWAHSDAQ